MLQNLAAIIVLIGVLSAFIYLLETYAPTTHRIMKAIILAAVALAVIRTVRVWACSWICG